MTVEVLCDTDKCTTANKLNIEKCTFDNNEAFQGSSVYLVQSRQMLLETTVCSSNFTNGRCGTTLTRGLACSGNVLLVSFSLTLTGSLLFAGNSLSAMSLHSSSVQLLPSTQVKFTNNHAINGAALCVVECSSMIVNSGAVLHFEGNQAFNYGGVKIVRHVHQVGGSSCFIYHSNWTLEPNDWNITVNFVENRASGQPNSIYIDSVYSCVWSAVETTFCWNGWFFEVNGKCLDFIKSGPAYITSTTSTNYTLYPGDCINLHNFIIHDDWGHNVTLETSLQVHSLDGNASLQRGYGDCVCMQSEILYYIDMSLHMYNNKNLPKCGDWNVRVLPLYDPALTNHTIQLLVRPSPQLPGIIPTFNHVQNISFQPGKDVF